MKKKILKKENKNIVLMGGLSLLVEIGILTCGCLTLSYPFYFFDAETPTTTFIIFFIMFLFFLYLFHKLIRDFIFIIKSKVNKIYLNKKGSKIETILKTYETVIVRLGRGFSNKYYYITSLWENSEDNKKHIFKSEFYNKEIMDKLAKFDTIFVYIDEKNPKKYYVDIEESINYKKNKYKQI